jgi:hypothetical protein
MGHMRIWALAGLLATVTATATASPLTFTFTFIDVPGAFSTSPHGINNAGHIVGGFFDSTVELHSFLKVGSTFTPFDVPGGQFTFANAINDAGHIVGSFTDGTGGRGFVKVGSTLYSH